MDSEFDKLLKDLEFNKRCIESDRAAASSVKMGIDGCWNLVAEFTKLKDYSHLIEALSSVIYGCIKVVHSFKSYSIEKSNEALDSLVKIFDEESVPLPIKLSACREYLSYYNCNSVHPSYPIMTEKAKSLFLSPEIINAPEEVISRKDKVGYMLFTLRLNPLEPEANLAADNLIKIVTNQDGIQSSVRIKGFSNVYHARALARVFNAINAPTEVIEDMCKIIEKRLADNWQQKLLLTEFARASNISSIRENPVYQMR